jgi:signal peptidase I
MSFDSAQNPELAQGADPDPSELAGLAELAELAARSAKTPQRPAEVEETTDLLAPSAPAVPGAPTSPADADLGDLGDPGDSAVADTAPGTDAGSDAETAARPYGRSRLLAGVIGRSWLWFIAGCLAVTLVPILFGWRPYVVESGSMQPRINIGDVVLAAPVSDRAQVLGRVIVFNSPSKKGEVVTHRVIRFAGPQLVTKGDANQIADTGRITMKDVRGLGRLLVRWVGLPLIWLQTKQWGLLLLFVASLWLAGLAVMRDQEEDEEESDSLDGQEPPLEGPGASADAPTRSSVTLAAVRRFPPLGRPGGATPVRRPGASGAAGGSGGASLRRALLRAQHRLVRPGLALRAVMVLTGALVLLVPSTMAAFAATTKSTTDSFSVPNWDYTTQVNALGPYLYWKLDETGTATTAADASGNGRTGTYNASGSTTYFTRLAGGGGFTTDTPNNAVTLNNANSCINTTSTTAIAAPTTMSEIIWFKAPSSYTSGGKLIGFETPRTGVAVAGGGGTYDRHLYMDGNGRIWFGVYNTAAVTISSAAGLNDGAWHMAVATFGPAGMHLYIDGTQVASNANTTGEATTGWFRVGCGNLAGWGTPSWTGPNSPGASSPAANYPFLGSLDEATVFMSQLTAAQVSFLYFTR